tara:strand:- start:1227 stop:1691 length:465 start_codon:yes stop_codon:yes gene_type:complete
MADTFKIQYSGRATPIEEVEAADGTKTRIIHSNIDKSIAGSIEYTLGSDASFLEYKNYTTTTSEVELGHSTIFNKNLNIDWMMVAITEAVGSTTPDCKIKFHGYGEIFWVWLKGVGDFTIMPMRSMNKDDALIELVSSNSNSIVKVDILIGEVL